MSRLSFDDIEYSKKNYQNVRIKRKRNSRNSKLLKSKQKKRKRNGNKRKLRRSKTFGSIFDTCAVCLDNDEILDTRLFPCKHAFHSDCVVDWVSQSNKFTCPMCRQNIDYFVQLSSKQNDKLTIAWNQHNLKSKNDSKSEELFTKEHPKIIDLEETNIIAHNEHNEHNEHEHEHGHSCNDENHNNLSFTSMVKEICGFIDQNVSLKPIQYPNSNILSEYYSISPEFIASTDKIGNKHESNIQITSKHDDSETNESDKSGMILYDSLTSFQCGLFGGFFGQIASKIVTKNHGFRFDKIPRTGMYFFGYESLKNVLNINGNNYNYNNDSEFLTFNKRLISGFISSQLFIKYNYINSMRFGLFFSIFESTKDNFMEFRGKNKLDIFDVFVSANVGCILTNTIVYPIANVRNIKYGLYKGFLNNLRLFLPSCVACSCVYESTKNLIPRINM